MLFSAHLASILVSLLVASSAHAHGVLTTVTGANGVAGQGFGVDASTPRDGTRRNPFQQDTSIIRDKEIADGDAGVCGRTLEGGNNDVATQLNTAATAGLPSAAADGTVTMTLHQVNGDGAGPYTCEVSADATGNSFVAMTVTTNVPGQNSRSNAKATDFPLVAQMPAGVACTGGPNADACLVRCRNDARAGPFGGCVAVTGANATAAAAPPAAVASAASTDTSLVAASSVAVAPPAASVVASAAPADASVVASASVAAPPAVSASAVAAAPPAASPAAVSSVAAAPAVAPPAAVASPAAAVPPAAGSALSPVAGVLGGILGRRSNVSIHDAELALAADLEKRRAARVQRSRIVGRRAFD